MARVVVLHASAPDIEERASALRGTHELEFVVPTGPRAVTALAAAPPDAVVVDLDKAPSQGRAIAVALRQRKATRAVPIVFAGGTAAAAERVRKLLPDATFATWRGVVGAVKRAIAKPPSELHVPGTMDDYAGVPLARKLGLREGTAVALLGAPQDFAARLSPAPRVVVRGQAQLVLLFVKRRSELERRFDAATRRVAENGSIWVAWPKKASGVKSDLDQTVVRRHGMDRGWVDFKVAALDETWSALRFRPRR